jgi:hypothetical protein
MQLLRPSPPSLLSSGRGLSSLWWKDLSRVLIVYVYNHSSQRAEENLIFFLRQGLHTSDVYHFVFVINGDVPNHISHLFRTLNGLRSNLEVHWRENSGFDTCAWHLALSDQLPDGALSRPLSDFSHFVLLNPSVLGPILPIYSSSPWPLIFLDMLSPLEWLVGTTMNAFYYKGSFLPHIQSMVLAFDRRVFPIFLDTVKCYSDKDEVVEKCEVGLSQRVLKEGGNLAVLQLAWRGHNFRNESSTKHKANQFLRGTSGDTYVEKGYGGININPLEVLFLKTNRDLDLRPILMYSAWQLQNRKWSLPCEDYRLLNLSIACESV